MPETGDHKGIVPACGKKTTKVSHKIKKKMQTSALWSYKEQFAEN